MTASCEGCSRFFVYGLDPGMHQTSSLVPGAYREGSYSGKVLIPPNTAALQIAADSAWRIGYSDTSIVARVSRHVEGHGDFVFFYTGSAGIAHITADGSHSFEVETLSESTGRPDDLLVNEIGHYDGVAPVPASSLIAVVADGSWSFALQ